MKFTIVFVVACSTAFASHAAAQQPQAAPVGIYVGALGGAVFGPKTASSFGVEFGESVHPNVQAYATLSYFEDLMDTTLRSDLAALSESLTTLTARTWALQGRDRGIGFVVGAKFLAGSGVRPYVGGGVGGLQLRRTITDRQVGDVTIATLNEFGVGTFGLAEGVTKPLIEATAGVVLGGGRTRVDLGYRYRRAFNLSQEMDFSQLAIGVGVNF